MSIDINPIRPAAARRRGNKADGQAPWPSAPAPDSALLLPGVLPTMEVIRITREYWGFTQAEAGAKVYVAGRTWQKWESGESKMPGAAWELFNIKAPQRDGTHFQFTSPGSGQARIEIGHYVALQPRRGPRLGVQVTALGNGSEDQLRPGVPLGRLHGQVVGFIESEASANLYHLRDMVRFCVSNVVWSTRHPANIGLDSPSMASIAQAL